MPHGLSERLRELADDYFFKADSLKIIPDDFTTDITYKEEVVKSITEMDAVWENTSREKLAEKYKNIISAAIVKYKSENSWSALVKDILIAILVLFYSYYHPLLPHQGYSGGLTAKIQRQRGKKIKGLKIRDYEILDAEHEVTLLVLIAQDFKMDHHYTPGLFLLWLSFLIFFPGPVVFPENCFPISWIP